MLKTNKMSNIRVSKKEDKEKELDISILIATYNRAEILRQTLQSLTGLDQDGLSVEFVIIDNNSSDHTKQVIESFRDRLPVRYLFESRPGKNCALNKALNEVDLGRIVVFTDDDVEPSEDWLKAIISITKRWPDYSVFGGRIYPIWPKVTVAEWTKIRSVQEIGFSVHDYADSECLYAQGEYPSGGNCWCRREVFANGRRFSETFGPRPGSYIMGSETSFLIHLTKERYGIVYSPMVVVGHCLRPEQLSLWYVVKRAYRYGRSIAHMGQPLLCRQTLLRNHPMVWWLIRLGAIVRLNVKFAASVISLIARKQPQKAVHTAEWIGWNIEWLKIARKDNSE